MRTIRNAAVMADPMQVLPVKLAQATFEIGE